MSWINDPVNSPKHYTDSHPGMECIDLTADKVHWWRFKALLHALPPETSLGKIVEIRGKDTSGMDRADRDYYETLKERFALPDGLKGVKRRETLQEHEDAFLDRFG